nr:MAG TPA: hypothetical protein [Caudoviricetes sp.]
MIAGSVDDPADLPWLSSRGSRCHIWTWNLNPHTV